jgi:hypothetical protein
MKSRLIYIDEELLYKLGKEPFIAYYLYQYKYCLAIFNGNTNGSIIPITPYFETIKNVFDYYVKETKHLPRESGIDYFENFIIVNRYQIVKSHL